MSQLGALYPAATMREFASAQPIDHGHQGYLSIAPSDNANVAHAPSILAGTKQALPASQESVQSIISSTFSAPALPSSSSNLSTSTGADTELTSPSSANVAPFQTNIPEALMLMPRSQDGAADVQAHAPRIDTSANPPRTGNTAGSPMSLDSPVNQGFKRSADGFVKVNGLGLGLQSPAAAPMAAHKRNKSMDTHRIGEVSYLR